MAATLAVLYLFGWGAAVWAGMIYPGFFGIAVIAFTLGLRHAFDADHIAAIDNTTRKLRQEGERSNSVGFFFSLGHSTVVLLIALALGLAVQWLVRSVISDNGQLRDIGGLVGTSVSGVFLILIGVLNLAVLADILRVYRRMRRGEYDHDSLGDELAAGGLMTRLFSRLFRVVNESWHMYPIGFLFGLGFDTASEVALLAITAGTAASGAPFYAILALPLIFAAGMSLMDTADGAFMAKAYGWAFSNPIRKVFYNMTVTGLSVFVALFVGGVELLQILIQVTGASGQPWAAIQGLDFAEIGFIIVAAFVLTWLVAFLVYRYRRVEERWSDLLERRPTISAD
jgi:high-affinity nickel-transport protein